MNSGRNLPNLTGKRNALVAVDLGAESCRVSLLRWVGDKDGGTPEITLVHRFVNAPVPSGESLHWNLARIEAGVEAGLRRCAELALEGIASVAVDGWGVDYVRLDRDARPLADPFCYRDRRTSAAAESVHARISPERLRHLTAIAPMLINTLYQQHADQTAALAADSWLQLPEYILFRLGGRAVAEQTNAAHTGMVDVHRRNWSAEIFDAASLPLARAPELVEPGTDVGPMQGPLAQLGAFRETRLIAPACHDTASAIAGIPALGEDWAYISSGTWSLVGTPVCSPIDSPEAAKDGFTNLAAAGGGFCFHANVNGMWMLSQCIEQWKQVSGKHAGKDWTIEELIAAAEALPPPRLLIDVDQRDLLLPGRMMQSINAQLRSAGDATIDEDPRSAPMFASLIFHSLARRYCEVLLKIERYTGKKLKRIFVVGGGSRNQFLNRLLGDAAGMVVRRGSAESSTIGNFAVQLAVQEVGDAPNAALVQRWALHLQNAYASNFP